MNVYVFLVDGFEESEAIIPIDMLRRAGAKVLTVSWENKKEVTGSHGITILADICAKDADFSYGDAFVIPGGPGYTTLKDDPAFVALIKQCFNDNKLIAAICSAPTILAKAGLLKGKNAICYPAYYEQLSESKIVKKPVVKEGQMIMSMGAGCSFDFAFAIVETLFSQERCDELKKTVIAVVE